jgi:hypothetical protein
MTCQRLNEAVPQSVFCAREPADEIPMVMIRAAGMRPKPTWVTALSRELRAGGASPGGQNACREDV